MARLLQNLFGNKALGAKLPALLLTVFVGGCILSPPIEPREEVNYSPRIDPELPNGANPYWRVTRERIIASNDEIILRADLLDGNEEAELEYVFVSDTDGIIVTGSADRRDERRSEGEDDFYFGKFEHVYDPCTSGVSIPGTEVFTLLVSDRGFETTSRQPEEIRPNPGGIMVIFSWTVSYEAGICDSEN